MKIGAHPGIDPRLEITVHIEETILVSDTLVFVTRVNCVHRLISHDLHLTVFGTETISSDKRSTDISVTLLLFYFVKTMSEHRHDLRLPENCVDPNS